MHGHLTPFIALLFNKSLATGCFPSEFKKSTGSASAEEGGARCHPAKKLQASVKLAVPV